MLTKMSKEYEGKLIEFLYKYNNLKEYTVAWVPENYSEILSYDKSNFLLCIEDGEVVGCLGTHVSGEQKIVRLLGPIIIREYFDKYIDSLCDSFMEELPADMKELRIAFFSENENCSKWCNRNGFELYNAEKTMVYRKEAFTEEEKPTSVRLIPYEQSFKDGLALVHPKETFFTLDELIDEISINHHLILAVDEGEVTGYIYYEISSDNKQAEVALLHVRENKRGKGYGTLLLKSAIRKFIDEGTEEIMTNVRVSNYGAQKLYERIGFVDKETIYAYKKLL